MELRIFIPTYRRVHRQITWDRLPQTVRACTTLVVSEDEEMQHRERGRPVIVSPDQGKGMAAIRGWITRYAQSKGKRLSKIAILDDDLTMQIRRDGKIPNATPEEIEQAFRWMDRTLDEVATCAFGVRFLDYKSEEPHTEATRQMQAIGLRTDIAKREGINWDVGVPPWMPMDDFNLTLQFLTKGFINRVSLLYRTCPAPANAPGGCSEQRTLARQNEAAQIIASRFPRYVKLREKKAWQGMEGKMYDVTVQWKMAYKEATK